MRTGMRKWQLVLLLLISGGAIWIIWDSSQLIYATPETESAFLKNYTPQQVLERFQCKDSSSHADGRTDGAGKDFVTHRASFRWFFAMRPDKFLPLIMALNDDMAAA